MRDFLLFGEWGNGTLSDFSCAAGRCAIFGLTPRMEQAAPQTQDSRDFSLSELAAVVLFIVCALSDAKPGRGGAADSKALQAVVIGA